MGKPRILIFTAMASLGLAACGTSSPGGNANAPTKVQIAAEGPFTGDQLKQRLKGLITPGAGFPAREVRQAASS